MIEGIYYKPIFYTIITIFSIVYYSKYASSNNIVYDNKGLALFLALFLGFFLGFRPPENVFADTVGLVMWYQSVKHEVFEFTWDTDNFIFDNLTRGMSASGFNYSIWLTLIALIYFIVRYVSCRKLFPNNTNIAFLIFLGSFITYSSAINGFKAGVATSLFACAVAYKNNLKVAILFLFLAVGMHHAMFVCITAYIIAYFYKRQNVYYYIWLTSLLLAIFHVTYFQSLFGSFAIEEKADAYLSLDSEGWRGGMRYDFVLYSAVPIIQSLFHRKRYRIISDKYAFVLNLYILLNSVWLLCMYANFTNRIAALSWGLYPIVILLPYTERNDRQEVYGICRSNISISRVLIYNLSFTLFMQVIYYGLIK